jgi:hypothetical protein
MRLTTSTDKALVIAFAKRTQRKIIWCGPDGVWHASVSKFHTPNYAVKIEYTPGVTHWLTAADKGGER